MFVYSTPTSLEADLVCKEVLEELCKGGFYPVILPCTSSPSSLLTDELKRIISDGSKPVMLRMTNKSRLVVCSELEYDKYGLIFPEELLLPNITHQLASAEELLDPEAPRTCQCSISGLIPELSEFTPNGSIVVSLSSEVQWTVIEGKNLLMYLDCCPTKPCEIFPEPKVAIDGLQATVLANMHTVEHDNTSDIKQGFNMKDEVPPSSTEYQETTKNGPEQFVDKQVATFSEDTFQGEVNFDRVQRSGSVSNIENHARHGALGVPLKENILLRVFKGVNTLKHKFWSSLILLCLSLGQILNFLGQKVGIQTGVLIFTIIGLGFPVFYEISENGPIASVEHNSIITQYVSLGILNVTNAPRLDMSSKSELDKDGAVLPKNLTFSITQQVAPAEHFSWLQRMNDIKDQHTCPRVFSGNQSTMMRGQVSSRILTTYYEGSNISFPRTSKTCQELQSVNVTLLSTSYTPQPNNTGGIKRDEYHLKAKVPSQSHQKREKDNSEQFVDKVDNSSQAMFQGEVNGGLIQRSKHLRDVMNYVYSLKYNFWNLVSLLFLLVAVIFGFMGRRPSIVIGVAISIILGVAISMFVPPSNDCIPPNPFQYDFATLMYGIARSLMLLSLVLQQTQREWLSHLMAGAAYSCVILFVFGHNFSHLPLNYACYGVAVLFSFVLFALWKHSR